jgi:hypothetical protein
MSEPRDILIAAARELRFMHMRELADQLEDVAASLLPTPTMPGPSALEMAAAVGAALRNGWNRDDITLAGWIAITARNAQLASEYQR